MKQRIINDSFWTDPYIEDLDPSEKLVFLYLLTNPLCNIAWIYEIKPRRMAFETWFDKDMIDKILTRFVEDNKILRVDDWVMIKNFWKNQSTNPNVKKWIQRIVDELPEKVKACKGFESLSHFTLLNLTLPNLTLLNSKEIEISDEISCDETSSSKSKKKSKKINIDKNEVIKEKTKKFLEMSKVINREKILEEYEISNEEFDSIWKNFVSYWTESNKSMTKIKWELETTFDISRRFYRFLNNNEKWSWRKKTRSSEIPDWKSF